MNAKRFKQILDRKILGDMVQLEHLKFSPLPRCLKNGIASMKSVHTHQTHGNVKVCTENVLYFVFSFGFVTFLDFFGFLLIFGFFFWVIFFLDFSIQIVTISALCTQLHPVLYPKGFRTQTKLWIKISMQVQLKNASLKATKSLNSRKSVISLKIKTFENNRPLFRLCSLGLPQLHII